MELDIKIYVKNKEGEPFLGRGPVRLMKIIDDTGSIRKAASSMEMSYSKAHAIIKKIEKDLNFKVTTKKIGGRTGGGTELTAKGKKLIEKYGNMENDIKSKADEIFKKFKKNL